MAGKPMGSSRSRRPRGDKDLSGDFGRYEILDVIGQGAMGTVYRARHKAMGNVHALKVLHERVSRKPRLVERFISEAKASGRLSHPCVVRGIDAGEVGGKHFFAMEYVDGPGLDEIIEREGRVPERRALEIVRDIARALEHASENHVVHRDIKPANILVGSDGRAKLADLGLAVRLDTEKKKAGSAMGTPDYISPEQIRGLPDVDIRSDIYSLGATLYQMLTGRRPFSGDPNEVMGRHLTEDFADPRETVEDLSADTVRILRKMTEKRRERRYQGPTELVEDIESALEGGDVALQQAGRSLASRRLRRRQRFNVGIAGIVGAVVLMIVVIAISFLGGGGESKPRPAPGGGREEKPAGGAADPAKKAEDEERKAEEAFDEARAFRAEHPDDFDGAIRRFREIVERFGEGWRGLVLDEVGKIKETRNRRAENAVASLEKAAEDDLDAGRFREARKRVRSFLEANKAFFGPTDAYRRAETLMEEVRTRTERAASRYEEEAVLCLAREAFGRAREASSRLRRIDPERYGAKADALLRRIEEAERRHREAEAEKRELALLEEARERAAGLVRAWKHEAAVDLFLEVRAEVQSLRAREAASADLSDLDRLRDFLKALGEAKGAVGHPMSVGGREGEVVDVAKGYVYLRMGRFKTGFRLEELSVDEVVRLAEMGLPPSNVDLQRGFLVYLLYHGRTARAGEILDTLDLPEEDRERYRQLLKE